MKTTLFMLMSVDGKISTGAVDERDFDKDLPDIPGAAEGLPQYYMLEKKTDYYSFNTGRVFAKVGWNIPDDARRNIPARFVIVDNRPHLTDVGVKNLLLYSKGLILVTSNKNHPAYHIDDPRLKIIEVDSSIDFSALFRTLEKTHGIKKMTIQSGSEMNAELIRSGVLDELSVVVAPVLVGGRDTSGLIGGPSLETIDELKKIRPLELIDAEKLKHNYLHLRYKIL